MNEPNPPKTDIKLGEFPFPLSDGPQESPYLTWLRNHSNYMAARGFRDYLRSIGVLVRGIVVNFLIFLPYLLIVAIALGYAHHWILGNPYTLTMWLLGAAAGWVLLFPVLTPLFKIFSYQQSLETGSESSIKLRDLYERSFGGILLAILAVAALESMPWVLEWFHDLLHNETFGLKEKLATLAAAFAVLSSSNKLLSVLSGVKKKLAMVLIGSLGLLVPLLVILYATDYLVYGPLPSPSATYSPLLVPMIAVLALMVAIPIGLWKRAFSPKECAMVLGLLFTGSVFIGAVFVWNISASKMADEKYYEVTKKIIAPLTRVAAEFSKVSNKQEMTPEVAALVDAVTITHKEYNNMESDTEEEYKNYHKSHLDLFKTLNSRNDEGGRITFFERIRVARAQWIISSKEAEFTERYFAFGQRFIKLGNELSVQPSVSLMPLRREISKLAHEQLLKQLGAEDRVAELLRQMLLAQTLSHDFPKPSLKDSATPNDDTATPKTFLQRVNEWAKSEWARSKWVESENARSEPVLQLTTIEDQLKKATSVVRSNLSRATVEDIAKLISEKELFELVETKFSEVSGKAKLARLVGKGELVKLVTKQDLIDYAFPDTPTVPRIRAEEIGRLVRHSFVAATIEKLKMQDESPQDVEQFPRTSTMTEAERTKIDGQRERITAQQQTRSSAVTLAELVDLEPRVAPNVIVASDKPADALVPELPCNEVWQRDVTTMLQKPFDAQEIAQVAGEELADLAIGDFNVKQLALVARARPTGGFNGWVFRDSELLKTITQKELEAFKKQAEVASKVPLKDLVKLAFRVDDHDTIETSRSPVEQITAVRVPDIYKVLVGYQSLRLAFYYDNNMPYIEFDARPTMPIMSRRRLIDMYSTGNWFYSDADSARDELVTLGPAGQFRRSGLSELEYAELEVRTLQPYDDHFNASVDDLVTGLMFGKHGRLNPDKLRSLKAELTAAVMNEKAILVFLLAAVLFVCWRFTVDINLTSIHGLYRDRLASAFLIGKNTKGDVTVEEDIDLDELCRYEARSKAPYHLVNAAINLQGSKDIGIRDRNSDFFIFSKRFIGGQRTGYCRSETMEQVFPQMSLATAMAVSAAAAAPNMGRSTSPLLVAFMTLLNIRLGFWMPNPGLLEVRLNKPRWTFWKKNLKRAKDPLGFTFEQVFAQELRDIHRRWGQVYSNDLFRELHCKEGKLTPTPTTAHGLVGLGLSGGGIRSALINLGIAQTLHKFGVFDHVDYMSTVSGGGYLGASISTLMRSRESLVSEIEGTVKIETEKLASEIAGTVEITREKPAVEVLETGKADTTKKDDADKYDWLVVVNPSEPSEKPRTYRFSYEATLAVKTGDRVTKGQLLIKYRNVTIKSSESGEERTYQFSTDALLNVRDRDNVAAGKPLLKPRATKNQSEIAGTVSVEGIGKEAQIVRVQGVQRDEHREYLFSKFDRLVVKTGDTVTAGQELIERHNTITERFRWRVRPVAFLREMLSQLDEKYRWINLSDGGHIENLAAIELLRRRCKYIIIGDGEADPDLCFGGLATLMRYAYIDLGIEIQINLDKLRLKKAKEDDAKCTVSSEHWAIGQIKYPADQHGNHEIGYLLYLKSSFTCDEGELIQEYRHRNPTFPHQTTADQFFDEGQFEAYRALGQHIAEKVIEAPSGEKTQDQMSFTQFEGWFTALFKAFEEAQKKSKSK